MVMGGIPHYLKEVSKGLSAAQNINVICFQENGLLFDEFDMLFHSLYENWLQILRSRVRFRALPDFLRSSGSGTGSTQPCEDN
jgi:hypothetical protein